MINRERKVDISKMDSETIDSLSAQIGEKVRVLCDDTALKINSILKIYGMSAKIAIQFCDLEGNLLTNTNKKKNRKSKQDNLNTKQG